MKLLRTKWSGTVPIQRVSDVGRALFASAEVINGSFSCCVTHLLGQMPSLEDLWPGAAESRTEINQLRQQLARAIEMLQIMQEELQAAHDELDKHSQ